MTVADLERRLTTREYMEWAAFYHAEAVAQEKAAKDAERKARRR